MVEPITGTLEQVLDKAQAQAQEGTISEAWVVPNRQMLILVKRPEPMQGPVVVQEMIVEAEVMPKLAAGEARERQPERKWRLVQVCGGFQEDIQPQAVNAVLDPEIGRASGSKELELLAPFGGLRLNLRWGLRKKQTLDWEQLPKILKQMIEESQRDG